MEITYTLVGDYCLPNLAAPESPKVGRWGMPLHKNITVTCSPNELPLILNASDVAASLVFPERKPASKYPLLWSRLWSNGIHR
mgnify:CR=1 FL=1